MINPTDLQLMPDDLTRPYSSLFNLETLRRYTRGGPKLVAVVGLGAGGGLALERLSALGFEVHGFEAADHVGGRTSTARQGGAQAERGAMRIPLNHHATRAALEYLSLPTRVFVNDNDLMPISVRGVRAPRRDWADIAYPLLLGVYDGQTRTPDVMWRAMMEQLLLQVPNRDLEHGWKPDLGGSEALQRLASVSLLQALVQAHQPRDRIEVVGLATGMWHYMQTEAREVLLEHHGGFGNRSMFEVVDGMEALVTGLISRGQQRGAQVHMEHQVTGVQMTSGGQGATLHWTSPQGRGCQEFDYVVIAVPAYEAARLEYNPGLPALQLEAMRHLTYVPAKKTILWYTHRHWELGRDGFAGGVAVKDGRMLVHPCDNAMPNPCRSHLATRIGSHAPSNDDEDTVVPSTFRARSREVSMTPAALVNYDWGDSARDGMDNLTSNRMRERDALEVVRALHDRDPYRGFLGSEHVAWPSAFRHDRPLEWGRYERYLHIPYPANDGRVVYAGEHVGHPHGWVQGALISAYAAVKAIAAAPSTTRSIRMV